MARIFRQAGDIACHGFADAGLQALHQIMAGAEQLRFLQAGGDGRFRRSAALAIECRKDLKVAVMSAAWLVNGKGTAQEALAQQAILASEATDPAIAESVKRLLATRRELANLVMTTPKQGQVEARQQRLVKLENEEQNLARDVGRATGRPSAPMANTAAEAVGNLSNSGLAAASVAPAWMARWMAYWWMPGLCPTRISTPARGPASRAGRPSAPVRRSCHAARQCHARRHRRGWPADP